MLTTEECLLSEVQQRNPGMSRADLEATFARYLGVQKVIWLERGIVGRRYTWARRRHRAVRRAEYGGDAYEDDPADANYEPLGENFSPTVARRRTKGKVVPRRRSCLCPPPLYFAGQRLPASYANFYIANRAVLVPTFDDPKDRLALNTLAELMPKHSIVPIYCGDLVWGLGTIHCMTQQQPEV